ncbi:bifunctional Xrn1 [Babesia duncani]|uniref:tRNA-intron lyase n=1 Tax=Babesia duncani TaxID=323732 RepID=A0AAD9PLV5_9APIC|nr:bifunctional Xrn1 [Babesia duncani]
MYGWMIENLGKINQSFDTCDFYEDVDYFYIDMNAVIHSATHGNMSPIVEIEDEQRMRRITSTLLKLFHMIKPKKVMYLAVDGVCPSAKINQQRTRRFRLAKKVEDLTARVQDICEMKPIEDYNIDKLPCGSYDNVTFNPNYISPGTEFMQMFDSEIKNWLAIKTLEKQWGDCLVIYDGANIPGEGEQKIYEFMRKLNESKVKSRNKNHLVYGLDADIMMLSLLTKMPNVCVLREKRDYTPHILSKIKPEPYFTPETGIVHYHANDYIDLEAKHFDVVSMMDIRRALYNRCIKYVGLKYDLANIPFLNQENVPNRLADDFVLLSFLAGNDFLPHLPTVDLEFHTFSDMLNSYFFMLPRLHGFITRGYRIHMGRLQKLFRVLQRQEVHVFKEKAQHESVPEYRDVTKYAEHYYRVKCNINYKNRNQVTRMCQEYIKGLVWNLYYYYKGCPSWNWCYKYHYAPLVSDLSQTSGVFVSFKRGRPIKPLEHLLAVSPPNGNELLPEQYRYGLLVINNACSKLSASPNGELAEFFPTDYEICEDGKVNEWEHVVKLPFLNTNKLVTHAEQANQHLKYNSLSKNKLGRVNVYKCRPHNVNKSGDNRLIFDDLTKKGLIVRDGMHYGATFSVYEAHSSCLIFARHGQTPIMIKDLVRWTRISQAANKRVLIITILYKTMNTSGWSSDFSSLSNSDKITGKDRINEQESISVPSGLHCGPAGRRTLIKWIEGMDDTNPGVVACRLWQDSQGFSDPVSKAAIDLLRLQGIPANVTYKTLFEQHLSKMLSSLINQSRNSQARLYSIAEKMIGMFQVAEIQPLICDVLDQLDEIPQFALPKLLDDAASANNFYKICNDGLKRKIWATSAVRLYEEMLPLFQEAVLCIQLGVLEPRMHHASFIQSCRERYEIVIEQICQMIGDCKSQASRQVFRLTMRIIKVLYVKSILGDKGDFQIYFTPHDHLDTALKLNWRDLAARSVGICFKSLQLEELDEAHDSFSSTDHSSFCALAHSIISRHQDMHKITSSDMQDLESFYTLWSLVDTVIASPCMSLDNEQIASVLNVVLGDLRIRDEIDLFDASFVLGHFEFLIKISKYIVTRSININEQLPEDQDTLGQWFSLASLGLSCGYIGACQFLFRAQWNNDTCIWHFPTETEPGKPISLSKLLGYTFPYNRSDQMCLDTLPPFFYKIVHGQASPHLSETSPVRNPYEANKASLRNLLCLYLPMVDVWKFKRAMMDLKAFEQNGYGTLLNSFKRQTFQTEKLLFYMQDMAIRDFESDDYDWTIARKLYQNLERLQALKLATPPHGTVMDPKSPQPHVDDGKRLMGTILIQGDITCGFIRMMGVSMVEASDEMARRLENYWKNLLQPYMCCMQFRLLRMLFSNWTKISSFSLDVLCKMVKGYPIVAFLPLFTKAPNCDISTALGRLSASLQGTLPNHSSKGWHRIVFTMYNKHS